MKIRRFGTLILIGLGWCLLSASALYQYQWGLPGWVPMPIEPANNPMSQAKVDLGRHLFYDKRLSADQSMSCASCHQQDKAFTDGLSVATGITGEKGARSAMSDRKSTRLNSSHVALSRMPSSA